MDVKDIVKKVKQIEIRTKRSTDSALMGQYQSTFKGQGMTFSEVRQYQFGDDIRRIDWNKTARFREPYVKVMEEEREHTVMLMVDISASMDYGTQQAIKREYIAEICATIGFSAVGNNDKVGLILFADKVYKVIPPKKGRSHVLAIVSSILKADYQPSVTDLDGAMEYLMKAFRKKSFVFMFSDFHDEFELKNLRVVGNKHQLLGLGVYDEKDLEIPNVGYLLVRDAETGKKIWVNTSNPRWRYTFAEAQKQKLKKIEEAFEQSKAFFLKLNSGQEYIKPLYNYFQTQ
ncbi:DUF58 domain-containing protein [Elizabethkingia sp. JS20170427COW]|uniref:DUF58 domain-containing protein n=1 Tax=Elizabethkingia sp. JS20170427COW TaxID=2583851 RepID=UPI001110745A|nr:DUF58 domain-containing protein [Elizabethkingia sp. JS20170427COW]QCX53931.1 DUF58 domain-containing protein [Elizabethkingia sp. JS20170427COW]